MHPHIERRPRRARAVTSDVRPPSPCSRGHETGAWPHAAQDQQRGVGSRRDRPKRPVDDLPRRQPTRRPWLCAKGCCYGRAPRVCQRGSGPQDELRGDRTSTWSPSTRCPTFVHLGQYGSDRPLASEHLHSPTKPGRRLLSAHTSRARAPPQHPPFASAVARAACRTPRESSPGFWSVVNYLLANIVTPIQWRSSRAAWSRPRPRASSGHLEGASGMYEEE